MSASRSQRVIGAAVALVLGLAMPAGARGAESAAQQLAARYSPVLSLAPQAHACGPGEAYRPTTVDIALGRRDVLHILYEDGTPRTKHVTTNVVIEIDEDAGKAVSRSYFTAMQAVPGMALQTIVSGRYHDRFERREGQWRFAERQVHTDLVGEVSRHLRRPDSADGPVG